MNSMRLSEAATVLDAQQRGRDVSFAGVSTDSRVPSAGGLFVALKGPRFDGHEFVDQAGDGGAVAAMVSRNVGTSLPLLIVRDTRTALGSLGAAWRHGSLATVVAVTGSNGKTTVKEMLNAILARRGRTLATRGNLNNEIGVPLTLLRLRDAHQFAVIEMGANHQGEIGYLTRLAAPDVAVVTNAAAAHLEGFGSVENVARAKGEIFSGLSDAGIAVINADDPHHEIWRQAAGDRRMLSFGLHEPADVMADWYAEPDGSQLALRTPQGSCELRLPLPGIHNVMNALAAAAASQAAGVDLATVCEGLQSVGAMRGRLQVRGQLDGVRIIDDTYNANPASLEAALQVLISGKGEKWLVMGDMAELGLQSDVLHAQAGRLARAAGVTRLLTLGQASRAAAEAFGGGADHFDECEDLISALRRDWPPGGALLVKGSRSMRMERVIEALLGARGD